MLSILMNVPLQSMCQTELKIGDTIPDIVFRQLNFIDGSVGSVDPSRYSLMILDFWNVNCGSCITSMPKLETFQKEFKNDLLILASTYNSIEDVKALFKKLKKPLPNLKMSVSDTVLRSWFPHQGDPYHIWIDNRKIVRKITSGSTATRENIQKALYENLISGSNYTKIQGLSPTSAIAEPILKDVPEAVGHLSLFSRYILSLELNSGFTVKVSSQADTASRITIRNKTMAFMYLLAYKDQLYDFAMNLLAAEDYSRLQIRGIDSSTLYPIEDSVISDTWLKKNLHSYELVTKEKDHSAINKIMIEDLDRYFNIQSQVEIKAIKCLALVKTDSLHRFAAKSSSTVSSAKVFHDSLQVENMSIKNSLIQHLTYNYYVDKLPVVDNTNFEGNITLKIPWHTGNKELMRKELRKWGLDLVEKVLPVKVLVLEKTR